MQKRLLRPSPAMVVSLVALFIALGGTSYAAIAAALPKNSVGTKQLKNGAVTAAKISSKALAAAKVVGAPGKPGYQNGWGTVNDGESVSFYKDPWGIVHIEGSTYHNSDAESTIFTLPAGYRPAGDLYFSVYGINGTGAAVEITSAGAVTEVVPQSYVGLSNISFRAKS